MSRIAYEKLTGLIPFLRHLFRFGPIPMNDFALALAGGFVAAELMELLNAVPFKK